MAKKIVFCRFTLDKNRRILYSHRSNFSCFMNSPIKALLFSAVLTQSVMAEDPFAEPVHPLDVQTDSLTAASNVKTTQQFHVSADGSVYNDSTTKYLGVKETLLQFNYANGTSKSATAQNGSTNDTLQDMIIAGAHQNDINDMLPYLNLGKETGASWYIEYTIFNQSNNSIVTITDYSLSLYAMHYHGDGQTAYGGNVTVELAPGYRADTNHSYSQTNVELIGSNTTEEAGVSSGTIITDLQNAFSLNPGESITLYATVSAPTHDTHENGYLYVGIKGFELAGSVTPTPAVPEPTTATLCLLALAGLTSRRRRK